VDLGSISNHEFVSGARLIETNPNYALQFMMEQSPNIS